MTDPTEATEAAPLKRYAHLFWPGLALTLLLVGPVLFLILLLQGLISPWWAVGVHEGSSRALNDIAPYVLVLVFGSMLGVAEVAAAFPEAATAALLSPWGSILVLANGLGTVIVYAAVMLHASAFDHPLIRAIAIAVGFAALIRTRFVVGRSVAPGDDAAEMSIDVGWPYRRFQRLCHEQISTYLEAKHSALVVRLLDRYPDAGELRRVAEWMVRRGENTDAAQAHVGELDRIYADDIPVALAMAEAANLAVAVGGRGAVELALTARTG